ncbi:sensor domain-containing protein [Vallicoccus soli]|uniref:EAL domain-containing protein n=1 Tax=Vallicoccus soli TaxID=2339232 RepID=A0A3A3Z320_9ACTN|nr:EAL domain-containing protein [Vallicoccus soli]RJK97814.1 EAL domain-containing protein [Vallicoccus soli]
MEPLRRAAGVADDTPALPEDLVDALDVVVFRTDAEGRWTYLNPAWTALTGWPVAESLGRPFLDWVHPDEVPATLALFLAVVEGGADVCHHEGRYLTRDGGHRLVQLHSRLLRGPDGAPVANVGTLTDVTERRAAERSVREHAPLLELGAHGAVHEDLPVGALEYDADLLVRTTSPAAERLLGAAAAPGAPLGRLEALLAEQSSGSVLHGPHGLLATALRTGRPQYGSVRLRRAAHGRRGALHVSVLPSGTAAHPDGGAGAGRADRADRGLALVLHDVTGLRRAEERQAAVARLGQHALAGGGLDDLLDEAASAVVGALEVERAAVLELLPRGDGLLARATAGWPGGVRGLARVPYDRADPLLGPPLTTGEPALAADASLLPGRDRLARALRDAGGSAVVPVVRPSAAGAAPFGVLVAQAPAERRLGEEEVAFLQAVATVLATAVTRLRAEEEVRHQALHDPLTGLGNRVLLVDRLEQALRQRRRAGGAVALLLLDLDGFKEVNDTLGHDAGDEVLRVVGGRLRTATRAGDTVARLGGDEFAVVLPGLPSPDEAVTVAAAVRERLADPVHAGSLALHVDASVGIALAPEHGEDADALLKRADLAMYRAKGLAGGVAVHRGEEPDGSPAGPDRLARSAALREAIAGDQLVLHYQPKVDLCSGATTSVEVLVRWERPGHGLVPPDAFIPLAERTGLIAPLTWRVLGLALDQARAWQDAGTPRAVAVNLSARVLHDGDLVARVLEELDRVGLPASALELELTESAVMQSPAGALDVVARLREAGVRLSLDDFGTGYSSLAYLRDLPVHELKIDRSFLRDAGRPGTDHGLVRTVIDLGHSFDLRVVGEGVEDRAACALLRELGCDEGQGYYFGRPVPAARLDLAPQAAC